jgi:hypothetical protein
MGEPYGVFNCDGKLMYIGLHDNEEDCWRVYLGWPDQAEIDDAKARGLMVSIVRCYRSLEPSPEELRRAADWFQSEQRD